MGPCAVLETLGAVAGSYDLPVMGQTVEERRGHLGGSEDRYPFTDAEVGGDGGFGPLAEAAQEVEPPANPGRLICRDGADAIRALVLGAQ